MYVAHSILVCVGSVYISQVCASYVSLVHALTMMSSVLLLVLEMIFSSLENLVTC